MPIKQLLPFILQKAKEDKVAKSKSDRETRIKDIQNLLQGGNLTPEQRDQKQSELSSLGKDPSADFLIPRGSFEPLFDQLGFNETLRSGVRDGTFTFSQAQKFNKQLNGSKPRSIEAVTAIYDDFTPEEKRKAVSPKHMLNKLKVADLFGQKEADRISGVVEDDLSDILPKIGQEFRSLSDVKDPVLRDRIIQRYPDEKDRAALFNDPISFQKLIENGKKAIREEGSALFDTAFNPFDRALKAWLNNDIKDGPSKDFLDKNYDRITQQLKGGAVVLAGRQSLKLEQRLKREVNLHPEERDLIKKALPDILKKQRQRGISKDKIRRGFEKRLKDGTLPFSERVMNVILDMLDE